MSQQDSNAPASSAPIDPDRIDPDALKILHRLSRHHYDAYLVGGCVRDLLLDLKPKDFDIATSAKPRQIRRLFRNSRIIGRRFKLAHIHFGPRIFEVATFRAPPIAEDEDDLYVRRDNVFGTAEQDARRRDFTINGMFYDVGRQTVIDHVDGLADLDARLIRVIGDPDIRLREDPVRVLRAAKFAGRLGFTLCDQLRDAATRHAEDLRKAAPPRVLEEFYRLLSNRGSADAFRILFELGALDVLIPEICPLQDSHCEALGRLERLTGGERQGVGQSLLLAVLLWPHVRPGLAELSIPDAEQVVQEALTPFIDRFTAARRDTAIARQSLAAQVRLALAPEGRRAHRFCQRSIFREALELRKIVGPISEDDPGKPEAWEEFADRHHREPVKEGQKKRPRRRRRRGRRGGERLPENAAEGKDGECPPSGSSSAPARPTPPRQSPNDSSSDGSAPA